VTNATITTLENVFEPYFLVAVADLALNSDGSMLFTSEETIATSIKVLDMNGKEYTPLQRSQIDSDALRIQENMKPIFAQAMGQLGKGIYFYFFKIKDENGKNLISANAPGEFMVTHSSAEFKWKLPLPTLLPAKYCPIDKEKMNGSWSYCPIHGSKL
jgi:hypothetical protein